jgi:hypothetical protein
VIGGHNDVGARCQRHAHEVFLVRCMACESLNREFKALNLQGERPWRKEQENG